MRSPWIMLSLMFVMPLAINACTDSGTSVERTQLPGSSATIYSYKGYNSKGTLVVVGSVSLDVTDSLVLGGAWKLDCIVPGEEVGPQTGNGSLTGSIQQEKVWLNLNPGWIDNNVFLTGTLGKDRFDGTWSWSTFVGQSSHGTFEAQRNQL